MMPMEPGPEDFARHMAEQRTRMQEARAIASFTHSRTGMLTRFLRRLADRVEPTGAARRTVR